MREMKPTSMEEIGQTGVKEITLRLIKINPESHKKSIHNTTIWFFSFFSYSKKRPKKTKNLPNPGIRARLLERWARVESHVWGEQNPPPINTAEVNQVPKHWFNFTKHPHQSWNHSASEVTLAGGKQNKSQPRERWETPSSARQRCMLGRHSWPTPHGGGRAGGEEPRTRTLLWCLSLPSITITVLCETVSSITFIQHFFVTCHRLQPCLRLYHTFFFCFLQNQEHQQVNNTLNNSNYHNTTCETQSHNIRILDNKTRALTMLCQVTVIALT